MNKEEQALLRLLRKSHTRETGFRTLVKTYQKPLYAQLRSLLGNHQDADDALQNTFLKAWKHIDSFKGDSALYTWLYRIAQNEGLTLIRKSSRMMTTEMDGHDVVQAHGPAPGGDEIAEKLRMAIDRLPEKQREVFNLKYYSDMKYQEIAELTGTSVGALKASYFHAVKKIEEFLTGG
jgi:RNA polymerase sigma-70 factor (ECF subfamily)